MNRLDQSDANYLKFTSTFDHFAWRIVNFLNLHRRLLAILFWPGFHTIRCCPAWLIARDERDSRFFASLSFLRLACFLLHNAVTRRVGRVSIIRQKSVSVAVTVELRRAKPIGPTKSRISKVCRIKPAAGCSQRESARDLLSQLRCTMKGLIVGTGAAC